MRVRIILRGCDDETHGYVQATVEQYNYLVELAQEVNKNSSHGCMPKMLVSEVKDEGSSGE